MGDRSDDTLKTKFPVEPDDTLGLEGFIRGLKVSLATKGYTLMLWGKIHSQHPELGLPVCYPSEDGISFSWKTIDYTLNVEVSCEGVCSWFVRDPRSSRYAGLDVSVEDELPVARLLSLV